MISLGDVFRRFGRDDGLGLVEVVAAIGVIFVVLLALAYTATVALNDIGLARQRQAASGIANEVLEQVRGLDFEALSTQGTSEPDPAHENVVDCGGVLRFGDGCDPDNEVLVYSADASVVSYEETDITVGDDPTEYRRRLYLTEASGDAAGALRAYVIVSWDATFRLGAASQVEAETLIYEPGFAPTSLEGTVSAPQGGVEIDGQILGQDIGLSLKGVSSRTDVESSVLVDSAEGRGLGSVVELALPGDPQTLGGQFVTSGADNDDATPGTPAYDTADLSGTADSINQPFGPLTTLVLAAGADSGTTISAAEGGGEPGWVCPDSPMPPESDALPCAWTSVDQADALSATLESSVEVDLLGLSGLVTVDLGTTTLAEIAPPVGPTTSFIDREGPSASEDRIELSGERSIGDVALLSVPEGLGSLLGGGDDHLIRLTGYSDAVTAEAGASTSEPSAAVQGSPQLEYWNPSVGGYTTVSPGEQVSLGVTVSGSISANNLVGTLVPVEVSLNGTLTNGMQPSVNDPDGPGSGIQRTSARAEVPSPVLGDLEFRIVVNPDGSNPVSLLDVDVNINFGTHVAQAEFVGGSS